MPSKGTSESEEDRYPFTTGDARNWMTGQGIVVGADEWWRVRLGHPDEWIPKLWARRGSAPVVDQTEADTPRDGRRSRQAATQQ